MRITLLKNNKPFYYPEFTNNIRVIPGIIYKTIKAGKYISERFAFKYFCEFAFGLNFIAKDILDDCLKKNIPCEIATSFNDSLPITKFYSLNNNFFNANKVVTALNNNKVAETDLNDLLCKPEIALSFISKYIIIKTGDLIFIPFITPYFNINIGDLIKISTDQEIFLQCKIK